MLDRTLGLPERWSPSEWLRSVWWAVEGDWPDGPPAAVPAQGILQSEVHEPEKAAPSITQRQRHTVAALERNMRATTVEELFGARVPR